jgi:hypothetical protein
MVFGNCGVLQEMSADKGFVEMTGIDAETSQDIAEVYPLAKCLIYTTDNQ